MTRHSRKYAEAMKTLDEKEKTLRDEIETESENFESSLVQALKIGGIVVGAAAIGYVLFRSLSTSSDEGDQQESEKKKPEITVEDGFMAKMIDRASEAAITGLVKAFSNYLTKSGKS